ncbi:glycoside hydrolase family 65 protein [Lacticigenium naphthae]|uniref:glycoside hydrolase family 65 protein n=1 Tax=Lacticigenium naphthae TaxID=515351 RepID=UPI0004199523|nr:glycoside hydrolase family 65 protein [Lacticigenium naphthae]
MKRLFEIDPWKVQTNEMDKENKRLQESLTSLGNGYMGMRGNFEEGYSGDTHIGTYLAGVWYPDKTRVGWWKIGYPEYFGKAINSTNYLPVSIEVDGKRVDLATDTFSDFSLSLDMKTGMLERSYIWENENKRIQFSFERFVSTATKELAVVNVKAKMLAGSATIQFIPAIDGDVKNEDSNYDEKFWLSLDHSTRNKSYITTKTKENPFGTERFTVTTMMSNLTNMDLTGKTDHEFYVEERYEIALAEGESTEVTKVISVVTSRDIEAVKQVDKATELIEIAEGKGYITLKEEHVAGWAERWQKADVEIEGDAESQQGVRFNIFQLFSTYYGEDPRLNVGPKGFTGEKYGGATYWDTESCILPMYLSVTDEEVSKQLLVYRHNQLEQAYHNAKQQGLKGALYPMVTFNGVESHNEWEITFEEIHRNGAIAHAIFNYTTYSGDEEYLKTKGIDVLTGIARFWADRVHYSKRNKKYMIHGVTGPNEYENNINNNWYTNTMATWTLRYTIESLEKVSAEKKEALDITKEETGHWKDIIENMYYPYDEELDVFIQHDTFLDKDLRPVESLAPEERPINQNWSWDKILRSPFIKQADVLQGLYFLNHEYSIEEKVKNFNYYEPMTVHESSLSPLVHSILASEIGNKEKAYEMYSRTARLDLDNYNNDTEDGLHITSMSGGWLSIVHGFAGMRTQTEALIFDPYCPQKWNSYSFTIKYRGRLIKVEVDQQEATFVLREGKELNIVVHNETIELKDTVTIPNK